MKWLYLSIGGLAGVFARYGVSGIAYKKLGSTFPIGTLLVNLSGCLLIGIFSSLAEDKLLLGPNERLLLMTGFCGAYTTFSTLMLETSNLVTDGELFYALSNVLISVILGFIVFRFGVWLGKAV